MGGCWYFVWAPGSAGPGVLFSQRYIRANCEISQLCLRSRVSFLISWNSLIQQIFVEQPPRVRHCYKSWEIVANKQTKNPGPCGADFLTRGEQQ